MGFKLKTSFSYYQKLFGAGACGVIGGVHASAAAKLSTST
jgi:hypothetical protein